MSDPIIRAAAGVYAPAEGPLVPVVRFLDPNCGEFFTIEARFVEQFVLQTRAAAESAMFQANQLADAPELARQLIRGRAEGRA